MEPIDVLLQILIDEGEGLDRLMVNGRLFDEAHVHACLTHPLFILSSDGWRGTRDGGPGEVANHPSCWGWVPDPGPLRARGRRLSLAEAVRKMTSEPAMRPGLADRELIRVGARADLMTFDPATVATTSTFACPGSRQLASTTLRRWCCCARRRTTTRALPGRLR